MTVDNKLVEKIQKLLALATSPNEHEARLAAEKASELLIRHNLTVSDLQAGEDITTKYKNEVAYEGRRMAFETKWVMSLVNTYFFVHVVYQPARVIPFHKYLNSPAKIYFIGTETNVAVAKYIFEFLVHKYKQLWKQHQQETGAHNHLKGAYYDGLSTGLAHQLRDRKKKVETETSLVVVRDPNLKTAVVKYHGPVTSGENVKPMVDDYRTQLAGYQEGKKLHISRGIESKGGNSNLALEHKKGK